MIAYYNEIDPFAAQWLRNLIAAKHIAPGDVDERDIRDVKPDDLRRYAQCHFFAGIGGWSYALRLAGWPDDRSVWTGSCPCQPFSAAGSQRGSEDERHLWPTFFRLIGECRPATVFGEQVAGAAGLAWLDHVHADLEGAGYAVAAADLPACSVGAPHRRQRLWWVATSGMANADQSIRGPYEFSRRCDPTSGTGLPDYSARSSDVSGMAYANGGHAEAERLQRSREYGQQQADGGAGWLGDASSLRRDELSKWEPGGEESQGGLRKPAGASPWRDLEWLACSDGKARPTQSGLFPLANGIPGRVGRLRAYGNAIVPQVAAKFIAAYMELQ